MTQKKYKTLINEFEKIADSVENAQDVLESLLEDDAKVVPMRGMTDEVHVSESSSFIDSTVPIKEEYKEIIRLMWLKLNSHKHDSPREAEKMFEEVWLVFEESNRTSNWLFL